MPAMRAVLGGLAVVSVLLVTAAARAEVIGVSNAGMDTGACGSAPRCETIDFAINSRAVRARFADDPVLGKFAAGEG